MPREPSDARAALMTVYMSQRSSFLTLSNPPNAGMEVKAAERPPPFRRIVAQKSTTTKMMVKSLKKPRHRRRRSDADECIHAIRTSLGGPGLGRIGRTIYGVGESSRANRRQRRNCSGGLPNSPGAKRSQGCLTAQQLAVIEVGMEIARREAESRHVLARKGMGEMGSLGLTRVESREGLCVKEEMEDMAHADRYFDMYINAEAWMATE